MSNPVQNDRVRDVLFDCRINVVSALGKNYDDQVWKVSVFLFAFRTNRT